MCTSVCHCALKPNLVCFSGFLCVSTNKRLSLSIMVSNWGCFLLLLLLILFLESEERWAWELSGGIVDLRVSLAWLGRKGSTVIKDYGSSTLNWRYWTWWVREDWEVASVHCPHPNNYFYYKAGTRNQDSYLRPGDQRLKPIFFFMKIKINIYFIFNKILHIK